MFLLIGGPGIDLLLDAVEPGAQHHRQREIRVARRVGHAQLDARRRAARRRHADQRAAVLLRPGDVGRRFVAGHQPLVGVHQRVGDRAEALGVAQDAADVVQAGLAQLPVGLGVVEDVGAAREQRHVRVHARAVDAVDRLGHERRVQAVLDRDVLHHEPERADVVGRRQHIVVAEVDLVLARARLRGAPLRRESPSPRARARSRGGRPRPGRPGSGRSSSPRRASRWSGRRSCVWNRKNSASGPAFIA